MNRLLQLATIVFATFLAAGNPADAAEAKASEATALIQKYCVDCHGGEKVEADIDLRPPYDQLSLLENHDIWENALEQIEWEEMPPKNPLPTPEEAEIMSEWIRGQVSEVDWTQFHSPGRVSLSRLTAHEYRNAVRDIFEVDLDAAYFLGADPEGNTGFTNDRDALTFPLFAFDNFMREAERVVDAYLSYIEPSYQKQYDLVEVWENSSDRSVDLNDAGDAVFLKERNAPFQLNLDVPHAGIYRIEVEAGTAKGEPVAASSLILNGRNVGHLILRGQKKKRYGISAHLSAGANVLSIGYDPDRAPIIQKILPPRKVPTSIAGKVREPKVKKYPFPEHLENNKNAKKAWQKLNTTIREYELTRRLAEHLTRTKQFDYEIHGLAPNSSRQLGRFGPSKVPFNLAAGSVAVFAQMPQKKLEGKIKEVTGFEHGEFSKTVKDYLAKWKEQNPERVVKNPGRIELFTATVSNHAIPDGGSNPAEVIKVALEADSTPSQFLGTFGTRAYGRKISREERETLEGIFEDSLEATGSRKEALRDSLVALLISPSFLIQYSRDGGTIESSDYAKRLSRFLWLSIPDTPLRSLATRGKLENPRVVETTVDRMISDPRFQDMVELFVNEWLDLDTLSLLEQGGTLKTHILAAMREEPAKLFHYVFRENRSLLELIDPDYTFLNDSLALHYDIPGVNGPEFRKVVLSDSSRGGILSMGAPLTATSTKERTSPVTRGAFIVELILGEELLPPPPSVPELNVDTKSRSVREELERHREDKACSGCHDKIDPYGFVLEHYDQFGAWRDMDGGRPVNSATTLEDGTDIDGLEAFKHYLVTKREEDLIRNLTERLFEFALGREVRYSDEAAIRSIIEAVKANDYRARSVIHEIVKSDAFRKQSSDTLTLTP